MVDEVVAERVLATLRSGTTDTYQVEPETPADGHTLAELNLRRATGATAIAIVRNDEPITNPSAELELRAGDLVVLVGDHAAIEAAFNLLDGKQSPPASG
jgi:K+/H+ antiporter YhaU regulatory subunit KhtT